MEVNCHATFYPKLFEQQRCSSNLYHDRFSQDISEQKAVISKQPFVQIHNQNEVPFSLSILIRCDEGGCR